MNIEEMAATVEAHDDYKVLRRLVEPWAPNELEGDILKGLYVDTESTGLNTEKDEIIELAMVPFQFTKDGLLCPGGDAYHSYNEPSIPIETEAEAVHGITLEMVKGHKITGIAEMVNSADIIIAHNASFDRRMLERFYDGFARKCWGCSMAEIPWPSKSRKLEHILTTLGYFYDAHGAVQDCLAGIYALQQEVEGRTALSHLLESARTTSYHAWAIDSSFHTKDMLKARKYFWNDGNDSRPKAWHKEVSEEHFAAEKEWLANTIYRRASNPARFDKVTAFERYSVRG